MHPMATYRPIELPRLPADAIAFTARGLRLLRGVVRLADSLELQTIAEGVESRAMLPVLRKLGCTGVQGFALGRPMSAEEFERQLASFMQTSGEIA